MDFYKVNPLKLGGSAQTVETPPFTLDLATCMRNIERGRIKDAPKSINYWSQSEATDLPLNAKLTYSFVQLRKAAPRSGKYDQDVVWWEHRGKCKDFDR